MSIRHLVFLSSMALLMATGEAVAEPVVPGPPIDPSCPEFPPLNLPGVLCEGFDTDRNGVPGFQLSRFPVGADPDDPLRAIGDPDDDVFGYTMSGGPSPLGAAGVICADDNLGFIGCQAPVAEENDWHLHSPLEGPGEGYDAAGFGPAIGSPDGGKARSGLRSMHMGRHLDPATTLSDTIRLRQVSAFVLDSQGDPDIPGLLLGPSSTLEFWQIMRMPDGSHPCGFAGCIPAFGGGQVHVSLLGDAGTFERWQRLTPSFNGYDSTIERTISLCAFDPGDDQLAPGDETMCDTSPVFNEKGDVFGTDPTCVSDTDGNDPAHGDCGRISCTPGQGCTETGSLGDGVWSRSAFDLSPFGGRVARLRWIGMMEGGWSFGTYRSALEPDPGSDAYQYYEADDGWWIDDIMVTDLRQPAPACADDDGDGFTDCDGDCADDDAAVNPGEPELPGDLRDENCDGEISCDPFGPWKNRGQFVRCVSQACESLVAGGFVTQEQCEQIVSRAGRLRFVEPSPEPAASPQENPGTPPMELLPEPR
ncbi:MAG: MopE-related protein [Candidatus Polarisedimenticolia bacterium]